jgi:hypothetical protein
MATLLDVVDLGCLAEPEVPVKFLRRIALREWATPITTADSDRDRLDVTEQALLDHVDRSQETVPTAALLRSNEKDLLAVLVTGVPDQLIFFQRQRQRFLAKNVFASLQGFDRDLDVPVVRSHDADGVDIISVQHLAVIRIGICLTLANVPVLPGLLSTS